jgi:hypothetical protein
LQGVVDPLLALGYRIVSMCVGSYDASFVSLLDYIVRIVTRVEGAMVFVVESGRVVRVPPIHVLPFACRFLSRVCSSEGKGGMLQGKGKGCGF